MGLKIRIGKFPLGKTLAIAQSTCCWVVVVTNICEDIVEGQCDLSFLGT